jgi:NIMA (never in mitosis gene a)-related kinase
MLSDIWSLGCVLYEICALKPLFRGIDMEGLFKKVQKGTLDRISTHYSKEIWQMLGACLTANPSHHPTCDQLLQYPLV